jgi:SsrA-binding protein
MKSISNKQAFFDYEILEKFTAGIVLTGQEVKSVKNGQMNLKGSYVTIRHVPVPELFLTNANIAKYKQAGPLPDYSPTRPRKLLVTKKEIEHFTGKLEQKGLTLIPLSVYINRNMIKLEFGLAKGKKNYQKKESLKMKDIDRDTKRAMKDY